MALQGHNADTLALVLVKIPGHFANAMPPEAKPGLRSFHFLRGQRLDAPQIQLSCAQNREL
jgi:hypothetical protein